MSETRSETARANGRKSRGPKTPEGKRRSSLNALTHGLTARTMVVCGEDAEKLAAIREAYIRDFAPQTQLECDLVDQIVSARWRLERAWLVEAALLDLQELEGREAVDAAFEGIEDATRLAIAFRELADQSSALALVHQYESRLSRSFDRALRNFRDTWPPHTTKHPPHTTHHTPVPEKRTQQVADSKEEERARYDHRGQRQLWAEADRMKGLAITQENLKNQRGVVGNEVKVNVLNQPYGGFPWMAT